MKSAGEPSAVQLRVVALVKQRRGRLGPKYLERWARTHPKSACARGSFGTTARRRINTGSGRPAKS